MKRKIVISLMFAYIILNLNVTYASIWQANGKVYCDNNFNGIIDSSDIPLRGVMVNIANEEGTFSITQENNKKGFFFIVLPSTPDSYLETLDESTLPIGSTFVIPSYNEHIFTLDNVRSDSKEWLIESDNCPTTTTTINPTTTTTIPSITTTIPGETTTTSQPPIEEFCGDGIINGDEECDGSDLGGETCENLGLIYAGVLACEEDCTFDMSGCYTASQPCGNGTIDCDDGISCTDDFCDQDTDLCVHIPDDTACPDNDGLYCNGGGICNPEHGCRPERRNPCSCGTACDEETDTCVPLPPIFYRSDFLEEGNPGGWDDSSLKSFEDVWTLGLGETVDVDMWLTELP